MVRYCGDCNHPEYQHSPVCKDCISEAQHGGSLIVCGLFVEEHSEGFSRY